MSVRTVLADYYAEAVRRDNPSTARMAVYRVAEAMGRFPLDMHDAEFALFVERTIQALVALADEQQSTNRRLLFEALPNVHVCGFCSRKIEEVAKPKNEGK